MPHEFTTSYSKDTIALFGYYKRLGERAMEQVSDHQFFEVLDEEMNSIAIIVKHMAGNMRSRWTDFLTTDGEKADRNRDNEFVDPPDTRAGVMKIWEQGWGYLFTALKPLNDDDVGKQVTIRGEPHSVMQAVNRQLAHYAYHTGQIVFLAKHFRSAAWKSLSVPRNKSAEFNRRVLAKELSQR